MSAIALVLLAAGVGVGYGWQPMSDGSNRYEYLVQLEPELLETLKEGRSIPIVGDVPAGIGPIGRIRVTVGSGELPRRRIVTELKPEVGAKSDSDIVLTQYNQYPAPTFAPPPSAAPTARAAAAAVDDAVSTWNGGNASSSAAPSTSWPAAAQQATDNVLRTAGQASAAADAAVNTWNSGAPTAPADPNGPFGKMGDGLDRFTQPLRNGMESVDNQVRNAASDLQEKTKKLANELTQPLTGGTTWNGAAPTAAPTTAPSLPAPPWNAGPTSAPAPTAGRYDQPPTTWNQDQRAADGLTAPPLASPPGFVGAPPAGTPSKVAGPAPAPGAPSPASQRLDQAIDPRDVGRWESRPTNGAGAGSSIVDNLATGPAAGSERSSGAPSQPILGSPTNSPAGNWPDDSRAAAPSDGRWPAVAGPTTSATATSGGAGATPRGPAIDKNMLAQPGDRQLEGGPGARQLALPAPPSTTPLAFPTTGPVTSGPPTGAAGQGWDFSTRPTGGQATGTKAPDATPPANGPHAMTVLAAWILLCGSAAGNLYLFWSYLDVRTKYRALVRKTARAVGSRFSAA